MCASGVLLFFYLVLYITLLGIVPAFERRGSVWKYLFFFRKTGLPRHSQNLPRRSGAEACVCIFYINKAGPLTRIPARRWNVVVKKCGGGNTYYSVAFIGYCLRKVPRRLEKDDVERVCVYGVRAGASAKYI